MTLPRLGRVLLSRFARAQLAPGRAPGRVAERAEQGPRELSPELRFEALAGARAPAGGHPAKPRAVIKEERAPSGRTRDRQLSSMAHFFEDRRRAKQS
jgi:hypothetical protein